MKPFFVYMLRCGDGTYYVGHTDDLEMRVAQHRAGAGEGYTRQRLPVDLVWAQETASREEAIVAELRIKGWGRAKKEALVRGDWQKVKELARSRQGLRQAQPERAVGGGAGASTGSARTGHAGGAGLRQAQPERAVGGGAGASTGSARTEHAGGAGLRQAQPERGGGGHEERGHCVPFALSLSKGRPELVEGPAPTSHATPPHHPDPLLAPLLQNERRALAKAITLLESTRSDHRQRADALLTALLPHTGRAIRLGISGVPGVGKSTFIEALGLHLIAQGHRVAVLAIDPSSTISGGSILGDKTRMEKLSISEHAYVRPSPAAGTLGGVAEKTREAMLACEAAGYDIVIVETVGVGQSETAVAHMTDLFVLLQLPNAGDDLQAIKRGVMELADMVVINKADLDPDAATRAEATITSALRVLSFHGPITHKPKVMQVSALKGQGIAEFWALVERLCSERRASGEADARRQRQSLAWMWELIQARLQSDFRHHPAVRKALPAALQDVAEARMAPSTAARTLLALFEPRPHPDEPEPR